MTNYKKYAGLLWQDDKYKLAIRLLNGLKYEKIHVDTIFSGLDLDTADYYLLNLLAFFGDRMNWLHFPESSIPRLSGLLRYNNARKRRLLNEAASSCAELKNNNVPAILAGELAACFYCDDFSNNLIGKAVVMIPSSVEMGFTKYVRYPRNTSEGERAFKNMLEDARTECLAGKEIKIPSLEDLVIFFLMEGYYEAAAGILCDESHQWMLHLSLLQEKIDWDKLMHRSAIFGEDNQVKTMLKFFDVMVSEVVPPEIINKCEAHIGWIERKFNPQKINSIDKLFHYIPDKLLEAGAMNYLGVLEITPRNYVMRSIVETIKVHCCCNR